MSWLIDTCVLSEVQRPAPDPSVRHWLAEQPETTLHPSVLTLAELHGGVIRLPAGQRRTALAAWMRQIQAMHSTRVLGMGMETAELWKELTWTARTRGAQLPAVDGLIAATAVRHGLAVVTRNVRDFEASGVEVFNPWQEDAAAPPADGSA